MKKAQPPKAPPPLSSDEMAVIKKKVAPPKGPPPVGLANFKAPKKYNENENDDYQRNNNNNNNDDDIEIDNNNNNHQNNHRYNNTNNNTNNNNNNTKGRYSNNMEYEYDDDNNCYDHDNLISNLNNNNSNNNKNFNYQSDSKQNNRNNNSKNKGRNDNFHDDDDGGNNNHNNDDEYENDYGDNSGNINGNNNHNHNHNNYSNPKSKRDHDYDEDNNNNSKKKNHDQSNLESKSLPPLDPHPLKPRVFNFRKILRASFKELKSFVTTPCDPNTIIRCYIERSRSGSNFLTPVYSLCADLEDGTGRELIACRKMLKSKTSYYVFSLKSEDLFRKREQRGKYYLGKLRAMSDNRYVLYDSGVCDTIRSNDTQNDTVDDISIDGDDEGHSSNSSPQRRQQHLQQQLQLQQQHHDDDNSLYRSQLAIIHYNSKVRPVNEGERGMEICIPHLVNGSDTSALRHVDMIPNFDKIQLVGKQNELFANKYTILHEKRSRYDPLSSCLVDFQGRATVASVKNFQLVMSTPMIDNPSSRIRAPMIAWSNNNEGNQEEVIFQMGKITGECFNMDFRSPLTMLQAFAIAVSRFDANLTW